MNYIIDSVIFSLGETNSHKYSVVEIDIDCVQLRAGWCARRDLNPHTTEVTEPKGDVTSGKDLVVCDLSHIHQPKTIYENC